MFGLVDSLRGRGKSKHLPSSVNPLELAEAFNKFFVIKIFNISIDLKSLECTTSPLSFVLQSSVAVSPIKMALFSLCSVDEIKQVLKTLSRASCQLDPIPTNILHELPYLVIIITNIINISLSIGHFPLHLKSAIVKPLLKKIDTSSRQLQKLSPSI